MTGSASIRAGLSPAVSGEWEDVQFLGGPASAVWDQTLDRAHVLYLEDLGNGEFRFAWDGVAGKPFALQPQANGSPLVWSPDGRRVAYYGRRGDRFFVGIDGTESDTFEGVTRSVPPTFSADGSRVAYGVITAAGTRLVVDGAMLGDWQPAPRPPVFSPDGMRLAFAAENFQLRQGDKRRDYRQWIVIDGEAQPEAIGVSSDPDGLQFSPDGRRLLYGELVDRGVRLLVDGQPTEAFEAMAFATFSPDSRRLVYAAGPKDRWSLFDDGVRKGSVYWRIGPPVFSPDGARVAHLGLRTKDRAVAVIDGVEGPELNDCWGNIEFSPDSRRVAYLGIWKTGGFLSRGSAVRLVLDGVTSDAWDEVAAPPRFSPDSQQVAFPARRGKAWHMVLDGQAGLSFDLVGPPRFSSSGRLGYMAMAREGGVDRFRVHVDGLESPTMDEPTEVRPGEAFLFSPDGDHVATVGRFGTEWRPVLDNRVGPGGAGAGSLGFDGDRAYALVSGPHGGVLRTSIQL